MKYQGEDLDGQLMRVDYKDNEDKCCPVCETLWPYFHVVYVFNDGRKELVRKCTHCHIIVVFENYVDDKRKKSNEDDISQDDNFFSDILPKPVKKPRKKKKSK